jgi:hypothetical protein
MYPLCRHILSANTPCGSPAVGGQLFCYHHGRQRKLTARPKRYGSVTVPLVFPEDHAAVQLNLQLIAIATLEGRIENKTSRALTNVYRACIANLKAGPLVEPDHKNAVQRVILTPDGEEISLPREVLEPGEKLAHGPECPCAVCAEKYRNAPMEQHHANCKCGLCGDSSGQRSAPGDQQSTTSDLLAPLNNQAPPTTTDVILSGAPGAESKDLHFQNQPGQPSNAGTTNPQPEKRSTSAQALHTSDPEPAPVPADPNESPYKAVLREYYARQEAKKAAEEAAQQAQTQSQTQSQTQTTHDQRVLSRAASSPVLSVPEPAANKYADPDYVPKGFRMYEEALAEVERNQQAGEEMWQRYVAREAAAGRTVEDPLADKGIVITHPDGTTSKRYLTWNEEEDLRVAARKKQKEEEEARQRQEAEALMAQCMPPVG